MDPFVVLGLSFVAGCILIAGGLYYLGRFLWKAYHGTRLVGSMLRGPKGEGAED